MSSSSNPDTPEADPSGSLRGSLRRYLATTGRRHPVVAIALSLALLLALAATVRLSGYMFWPSRTDLSLVPNDPFLVRHSCVSSYLVGAILFKQGAANLYDVSHYRPGVADHGLAIGEMDQDPYQYPPVLLVPFQALLAFSQDFTTLRAAWFLIQGALILTCLVLAARHVGGVQGWNALLLIPLVWGSPPNLSALQFGNIQGIVVGAAILGMICLERKWLWLGSGLLAFSIHAKIFPIVLVVYLFAGRRWREVAAVAVWGMVFALAVVVFGGTAPWWGFLTYQLPRLSSGEAFNELFTATPVTALMNLAFSSLPYKLDALGWVDAPQVSRSAATLGNMIVLILAVALGRNTYRQEKVESPLGTEARLRHMLVWLLLINLSTLQSTMSPHYAVFGTFWLVTLWAAGRREANLAATAGLVLMALLALSVVIPVSTALAAGTTLVVQVVNIGINLAVAASSLSSGRELRT